MTKARAPHLRARPADTVAARAVDVVKSYGAGDTEVRALDHVSVDLVRGEFTAIMGPSGSGKSTLMHCLAGLDSVTSGSVAIGGVELAGLSDKKLTALRRDRIGFVFQAFNLVPTLTALENITLPIAIAGRKPDEQWLNTVIDTLGIRDRLGHRPSELSGGQQQRVAVGRALAGRPEIIFGDEPTGNLDSRSSGEVLGMLRRSVDELGQTVVIVTHDPHAAGYADRVLFLADGRIVDEMRNPTADSVLDKHEAAGEPDERHATVSLRNLGAHKVRLALTVISVLLGTAFVAGSFVFTDTLKGSFNTIFDSSSKGIDTRVQAKHDYDPGVPTSARPRDRSRARRATWSRRSRADRPGRLARQEDPVERRARARAARGRRTRSTRCRRSERPRAAAPPARSSSMTAPPSSTTCTPATTSRSSSPTPRSSTRRSAASTRSTSTPAATSARCSRRRRR